MMHFEGDAFISYAHLDDIELVEGKKGWVANLHRALEVRVAQLLGKPPHIWRDPKLKGNDLFADTLVEKLHRVAVLVTVVSPRYIKSEWTIRELKAFWQAAEEQGGIRVGDKARIFKILKTPIPLDKTPPELRTLLGYEFFKVDPDTGRIRELDEVFGADAQREFWIKLDDLAHDLVALLEELDPEAGDTLDAGPDVIPSVDGDAPPSAAAARPPAAAVPAPVRGPATPAGRGTVFLAETTSDLREQREQLRRDLLQHGYTVLPAAPLPIVADEAVEALRDDLSRCRMSIHLVGKSYSLVPEGGAMSMIEVQHELATERAAADQRFLRLVWLPAGFTTADPRQQQLVERLRLDPRIEARADLLETMFEDLRTTVQEWLTREPGVPARAQPPAGPASVPELYIVADQRDADLIEPWVDALFNQHLEVIRPLFDGDESSIREYHEENLTHCDGVLIFYGAGNELWLQRKLRELQKAPGYGRTKPRSVVGVALVGPRTPQKERFRSHDALVVAQWDGVSLPALQPFIAQLKAGPPV